MPPPGSIPIHTCMVGWTCRGYILVTIHRCRGTRSLIVNNDLVISREKYIKKLTYSRISCPVRSGSHLEVLVLVFLTIHHSQSTHSLIVNSNLVKEKNEFTYLWFEMIASRASESGTFVLLSKWWCCC